MAVSGEQCDTSEHEGSEEHGEVESDVVVEDFDDEEEDYTDMLESMNHLLSNQGTLVPKVIFGLGLKFRLSFFQIL